MNDYSESAHIRQLADQLVAGAVDFLEAGDCRHPGLSAGLRAVATGDAALPIAIEQANKGSRLSEMTRLSMDEAVARLQKHALELSREMGPAARIFTVRLRKPA